MEVSIVIAVIVLNTSAYLITLLKEKQVCNCCSVFSSEGMGRKLSKIQYRQNLRIFNFLFFVCSVLFLVVLKDLLLVLCLAQRLTPSSVPRDYSWWADAWDGTWTNYVQGKHPKYSTLPLAPKILNFLPHHLLLQKHFYSVRNQQSFSTFLESLTSPSPQSEWRWQWRSTRH